MNDRWDSEVTAALSAVSDPCSVAAGAALSLLDMGLVRGWAISPEGDLEVRLDVTTPMCLMAGHFIDDAQRRLEAIPGVRNVTVRVEPSGDWSPARISRRGQELLRRRRREPARLRRGVYPGEVT